VSADPQRSDWGGLSWSEWCPFDHAVAENLVPESGGIYRFHSRGEQGLLYIGEGANRRRRLRTLERQSIAHPPAYYLDWPHGTKRPHRGHYAAPFLRMCRDAGCAVEVSWAMDVHADLAERRRVEARLIRQYRAEAQSDPPWQHGGIGMATYLARRQGAPTRDNHQVVARYFEMWNTGESSIADQIVHPDWTDHAHPDVKGPEGVRRAVDSSRATRPDLHIRVEAILGDGDLVAAVGELSQDPDSTASPLIWLIRIEDHRLAEMWTYR
jgi:predicted SnoaL-like aldol condensation-catalyzing enzyme